MNSNKKEQRRKLIKYTKKINHVLKHIDIPSKTLFSQFNTYNEFLDYIAHLNEQEQGKWFNSSRQLDNKRGIFISDHEHGKCNVYVKRSKDSGNITGVRIVTPEARDKDDEAKRYETCIGSVDSNSNLLITNSLNLFSE